MPNRAPDRKVGLPTIVPEVRTTDTSQYDTHDRIGRLFDGGVWSFANLNLPWALKNRCFHSFLLLSPAPSQEHPFSPCRDAAIYGERMSDHEARGQASYCSSLTFSIQSTVLPSRR